MRHIYLSMQKLALAIFLLLAVSLILILFSVPAAWVDGPDEDLKIDTSRERLRINNANIINVVDGSVSEKQQIDIVEGRITQITTNRSEECPVSIVCVDVSGAYVIPGLTDMHVHIHDRKDLVLNLAYGVTRVRNLRGMPMHLRWKKEVEQGDWLGADLITSSPTLNHSNSRFFHQSVKNPEHAKQLVRRYQNLGFDLIKVYGYIEPESLKAIIQEAEKIKMPIVKHGPHGAFIPSSDGGAPKLETLSSVAGMQSLEHVEDILQGPLGYHFDTVELSKIIDGLAGIGSVITPTLATFNHLCELSAGKHDYISTLSTQRINPFFRLLNKHYAVKRWLSAGPEQVEWNLQGRQYLFLITRALSDANIPLLVGSDSGTMYMSAGHSTIEEMRLMSKAGVPTLKVLQGATSLPAQVLGMEHETGSVSVGKQADLVVLSDNPLNDLSVLENPLAVVKRGHWLDRSALAELKKSADHQSGYYPSLGRFIEDILTRLWH